MLPNLIASTTELIVMQASVFVFCWAITLMAFLMGYWIEGIMRKGELKNYRMGGDRDE